MVFYGHKTIYHPPISRRMAGALQSAYYSGIELTTVLHQSICFEVTDLLLSGDKKQQDCPF